MLTMTLRTTVFAAAVLACASAATSSRAQEATAPAPELDQSQLLKNINAMNDDNQDTFLLALTTKANTDLDARFAKIENNVFAPATPANVDAVEANIAIATANSRNVFDRLVMDGAELEMNAKVANIENPFEPHLPMSPFLIAFTIHD